MSVEFKVHIFWNIFAGTSVINKFIQLEFRKYTRPDEDQLTNMLSTYQGSYCNFPFSVGANTCASELILKDVDK